MGLVGCKTGSNGPRPGAFALLLCPGPRDLAGLERGLGVAVGVGAACAFPVKAEVREAGHNLWSSVRINAAAVRRADSDQVRFLWNGSLSKCTWPPAAGLCCSLCGIDLDVSSLGYFCSCSSPPPKTLRYLDVFIMSWWFPSNFCGNKLD